jgi:hypothetical protein
MDRYLVVAPVTDDISSSIAMRLARLKGQRSKPQSGRKFVTFPLPGGSPTDAQLEFLARLGADAYAASG